MPINFIWKFVGPKIFFFRWLRFWVFLLGILQYRIKLANWAFWAKINFLLNPSFISFSWIFFQKSKFNQKCGNLRKLPICRDKIQSSIEDNSQRQLFSRFMVQWLKQIRENKIVWRDDSWISQIQQFLSLSLRRLNFWISINIYISYLISKDLWFLSKILEIFSGNFLDLL